MWYEKQICNMPKALNRYQLDVFWTQYIVFLIFKHGFNQMHLIQLISLILETPEPEMSASEKGGI